jgi:hypothetical protein
MFGGSIPALSSPIPRRWTEVGRQDLIEASGDHMLSQKLLRDVGIYTFAGENLPLVA